MSVSHPPSTAAVASHPIHATLVPFPIACFTLTLLTDIAYWQSSHLMWKHFSEWLLLAGLVFGALAALAGAVDLLSRREIRRLAPAWPHALGGVIVGIPIGLAEPSLAYWLQSGNLVFMLLLGGYTNFFGPVLGAIMFIFFQDQLTSYTEYWRLTFGVLLAVIVIFSPPV